MKITLTSVYVADQEKALCFYTGVLGFVKLNDTCGNLIQITQLTW